MKKSSPTSSPLAKGRIEEGFGKREQKEMTLHYNKKSEQEKRRTLRKEMTFCEKIMWKYLRKKQFGIRFLRQYSIDAFVIDFYSPEIKLAIELDGEVHNLPEQKEYDKHRQKYIESFGVTFVRITNDEFMGNPDKAFKKIENKITEIKTSSTSSPLAKGRIEEGFGKRG